MANSYKNVSSAKKAFGNLQSGQDASDHTKNISMLNMYKNINRCHAYTRVLNSSQLMNIRNMEIMRNSRYYNYNKANLSLNLVSKLNLKNLCVIKVATGLCPAIMDCAYVPYTTYIIDPSGDLFGNTPCGLTNYTNFLECNEKK